MMRTLVDVVDGDLKILDQLARDRGQSRAALFREAVADYIARHRRTDPADAFGLWSRRGQDGLTYQEQVRAEW